MVAAGETLTEPEVAPPVLKPLPVQDVAFVEDQDSEEEEPAVIEVGTAESVAVGAGGVAAAEITAWQPYAGAPLKEPWGPVRVPLVGPPPYE